MERLVQRRVHVEIAEYLAGAEAATSPTPLWSLQSKETVAGAKRDNKSQT
jgi:hypothetical protein